MYIFIKTPTSHPFLRRVIIIVVRIKRILFSHMQKSAFCNNIYQIIFCLLQKQIELDTVF